MSNNQESDNEIQMLTFTIDEVCYGVDVRQVREVKDFKAVTPLPHAPEYIKGVTNLRGEVIPIVDLRKRFGIVNGKKESETDVMIVVEGKHPFGVTVSSVKEVVTFSKSDVESNPEKISEYGAEAIKGLAKHNDELIIVLDLTKVL
ncbi:MAG: chemotaxis protein CheW [Candidatus Bathyarchaeia archaeon]|jgi:purine-binding chemotaxis protein CheW